MQRTKALGLLHKTIIKDSAMSRMGIPDYLVVMRKEGENIKPVSGALQYYVGDNPPASFESNERADGSLYWTIANENGTPIDIWQQCIANLDRHKPDALCSTRMHAQAMTSGTFARCSLT